MMVEDALTIDNPESLQYLAESGYFHKGKLYAVSLLTFIARYTGRRTLQS